MSRNPPKPGGGALASLALAMRSKRTAFVVLQSFASGLPLGLVWIAIPDWMRDIGVDIRVVGLITLAQAPWTFKLLWAPLMDRYVPPFWGRRRGWMAVTQVALFAVESAAGWRRPAAGSDLGRRRAGDGDCARVCDAGHRHRRLRRRGSAQRRAGRSGRRARGRLPGRDVRIEWAGDQHGGARGLARRSTLSWRSSTCRCSSSRGSRQSRRCRRRRRERCATQCGSRF